MRLAPRPAVLSAMSVAAIAVVVMAACAAQPPGTTAPPTPTPAPTPRATLTPSVPVLTPTMWDWEPRPQHALGTPFSLRAGQSAEVDGARLLVHLSAVSNDSRCPADVVCVHAGSVTVRLELVTQLAGTTGAEIVFQADRAAATHGGYLIAVTGVQPYPLTAGTPIAGADYVVSLVVERAG